MLNNKLSFKLNPKGFNYGYIILLFFVLSLCADFIDKIEIFHKIDFIKFNRLLKGAFIIFCLFFIIKHFKFVLKELKYVLVLTLILCVIFLIKIDYLDLYKQEFLRYVFLFLSFPLLFYVFYIEKLDIKTSLYKVFKYAILLNTVVIIIGALFSLKIVETYKFTRFGYNGILLSQGFTPYFYLAATMLFWSFRDKKMFLLTLILSIVSGIKGVYFAECLALSLMVLCNKELSKMFKIKVLSVLFIVFAALVIILLNTHPFKELMDSNSFLSALFSYRTDNLLCEIETLSRDNFNIFIGANGADISRLELQIVDIFMFFGLTGLLVYGVFVFKLIKIIKGNTLALIFLATAVLLSALSGNLFYIPLSSFVLVITLFSLVQIQDSTV